MPCKCCREGAKRELVGSVSFEKADVFVGVDPSLKSRDGSRRSYLTVQTMGELPRLIPINYCPVCGREL